MRLQSRRSGLAVPGAVLLSLVLVGPALAAHTWSAAIPLTTSGDGFVDGVAGLNATTAVAAYVEWNGSWYDVKVKRTTTSGSSWSGPTTLSTNGYGAAIAGFDPYVDVVWMQNRRVRYSRSVDGGLTYSAPMALSARSFPINLSVAHGPGNVVVVAWQNSPTNAIKVRVSTNGGVSFGPTTTFSSNVNDMGTAVAAGDGVVYLAYRTRISRLVVRRSQNGGATWSTPKVVSTDALGSIPSGWMSMTAAGGHAYLAYPDRHPTRPGDGTVRYRRTLDSGATWSSELNLAPTAWDTAQPQIALQGDVVRAVYLRDNGTVYYQQSGNGLAWSSAELVDYGNFPYVTQAGSVIVVYHVWWSGADHDVFARTGT